MKKAIEKLEKELTKAQAELVAIEEELSDTALYGADQKDPLKLVLARQAASTQKVEALEERWLEGHEELEAMERAEAG
jgi:ATP-binding cassette subfamily F protein 3